MTNQEVFDRVATYLLREQATRSADPITGQCYYRVFEEGKVVNRCAIGALLPDPMYCLEMESFGVDNLMGGFEAVAHLFYNVDPGLLTDLQAAHDIDAPSWEALHFEAKQERRLSPINVGLRRDALQTIAARYNLNPAEALK